MPRLSYASASRHDPLSHSLSHSFSPFRPTTHLTLAGSRAFTPLRVVVLASPCGVNWSMKGGSGIEVRLYGIGATLWLSAFVDVTLRLLACKMTDSDALVPSIILISIAWPHNSNPVHIASLEYATTLREAVLLYAALIVTTACVLSPVAAAIHEGDEKAGGHWRGASYQSFLAAYWHLRCENAPHRFLLPLAGVLQCGLYHILRKIRIPSTRSFLRRAATRRGRAASSRLCSARHVKQICVTSSTTCVTGAKDDVHGPSPHSNWEEMLIVGRKDKGVAGDPDRRLRHIFRYLSATVWISPPYNHFPISTLNPSGLYTPIQYQEWFGKTDVWGGATSTLMCLYVPVGPVLWLILQNCTDPKENRPAVDLIALRHRGSSVSHCTLRNWLDCDTSHTRRACSRRAIGTLRHQLSFTFPDIHSFHPPAFASPPELIGIRSLRAFLPKRHRIPDSPVAALVWSYGVHACPSTRHGRPLLRLCSLWGSRASQGTNVARGVHGGVLDLPLGFEGPQPVPPRLTSVSTPYSLRHVPLDVSFSLKCDSAVLAQPATIALRRAPFPHLPVARRRRGLDSLLLIPQMSMVFARCEHFFIWVQRARRTIPCWSSCGRDTLLRFLGVRGFPDISSLAADDRKNLYLLSSGIGVPCSMLKTLVSRCQVVRHVNA
ncbi:hypothetical protein B0H13DRAFT_2655933 [Mycena leptocephala]|nr:hypothetical protein B0H13DRAFT_2655933 [Mycena leptocephala]